jgi:hypothetical protein
MILVKRRRFRPWRLRGNTLYRCTLAEAAERLGYTIEGTRRRLRSGKLRGYRLDGQWYVIMPGFTRNRALRRPTRR